MGKRSASSDYPKVNKKVESHAKVKDICKKFENLGHKVEREEISDDLNREMTNANSNVQRDSVMTCETKMPERTSHSKIKRSTPVAPVRKNKYLSSHATSDSICNKIPQNIGLDPSRVNLKSTISNEVVSVRERTKLFEYNSTNKNTSNNSTLEREISEKSTPCQKLENTFIKSSNAPSKPPRVNISKNSVERLNDPSATPGNGKELQINHPLPVSKQNTESTDNVLLRSKNLPGKESRITFTSNIHMLRNSVKNLGITACELCKKVKEKSSSVFVDLTSTTVRQPKHYGTLKRSFSEEHIYAEPMFDLPDSHITSGKGLDSLHYKCASIVPCDSPEVSQQDGSNGKSRKLALTASVQGMIYESFSSLRPTAETHQHAGDTTRGEGEVDITVNDVKERIIYVKSVKKLVPEQKPDVKPKLYEVLFVINVTSNGPETTFQYPETVPKGFHHPLVAHLCFPDFQSLDVSENSKSEMFHFTLIGNRGEKIFGYCHRIFDSPSQAENSRYSAALCILSTYQSVPFYKSLLSQIGNHMISTHHFQQYVTSLHQHFVPNPGRSICIPDFIKQKLEDQISSSHMLVIENPLDPYFLSTNLTRMLQLLDVDLLLKCICTLLLERRVLLLSKSSRNLRACCDAILSLLYPLQWPHLVIPVVPSCMVVQCCVESPYLLGIATKDYDPILDLLSEHQMLILDIDKGSILKSCGDESCILPTKAYNGLIRALNLSKNMTDPTELIRNVMISEATVHMFVELLGHYEDHFVEIENSPTFQKEAFQKSAQSRSVQLFLQWFSETAMFESFIKECMHRQSLQEISNIYVLTHFEKRVEQYKWEVLHSDGKFSKKLGKTVKIIGERLKGLKR